MTPEQQYLIQQAKESLAAAKLLLQEGYPGFAASRVYYTMFYVAKAGLLNKGLTFSKHSTVVSVFGQHFPRQAKSRLSFISTSLKQWKLITLAITAPVL